MHLVTRISGYLFEGSIVSATICSYIFCRKKYNPGYLKPFPVYLTGSLIATLPLWIPILNRFNLFIQTMFTFFEMIFFFVFFNNVIYEKTNSKKMVGISVGIVIICFVDLLHNGNFKNYDLYVIADLLSVTLLTLIYFKKIFTDEPTKDLFKEPSFWVSAGCLIYFLGVMPLFIFEYYLASKVKWTLFINFYTINYILFTIMSLLLIKSFTCKQKVSI